MIQNKNADSHRCTYHAATVQIRAQSRNNGNHALNLLVV